MYYLQLFLKFKNRFVSQSAYLKTYMYLNTYSLAKPTRCSNPELVFLDTSNQLKQPIFSAKSPPA